MSKKSEATTGTNAATTVDGSDKPRAIINYAMAAVDATHNIRKVDTASEDYLALRDSIEFRGLDEPIQLSGFSDNGKRWIVAGHHRYQAFLDLKKTTIPAVIREDITTRYQFIRAVTRSNTARKQLSSAEQLYAVREIVESAEKEGEKPTAKEIGTDIGKSESHVGNLLRIARGLAPVPFKAYKDETKVGGVLLVPFDVAAKWARLGHDEQIRLMDARKEHLKLLNEKGATDASADEKTDEKTNKDDKADESVQRMLNRKEVTALHDAADPSKDIAENFFVELAGGEQVECDEKIRAVIARVLDLILNPLTRGGNPRDVIRWDEIEKEEEKKTESGKTAKGKKGFAAATPKKKSAKK